MENILFLIFAYFAAIAATLAGFGSSTLLVPVAVFFMDIKTAVFLVACFHLFNNIFKVKLFWGKVDGKTFLYFGVPSILFSFAGALLITTVPVESVKLTLAVFLVSFSVFSFVQPSLTLKAGPGMAALGGGLSGFLAGLIGLGGAIRAAFLVAFNLPKEIYVATSAAIALVVDLTRIPTYWFSRVVQDEPRYVLLPFLFVLAYLGVRTGKLLLDRIDQVFFRKIVLAALLLLGLKLLF